MNLLSTKKLTRMYKRDIRRARCQENNYYSALAETFYSRAAKIEAILKERGVKIV